VTVAGIPAPQGSKRHVGNGILVESSKKVGPWREAVAAAVLAKTGGRVLFPSGPVAVAVVFYLPRPRSHYGTGRNAGVLKVSAPRYPFGQPDVDKLLRSTLDGLTAARVFGDDAQVAKAHAVKVYAYSTPRHLAGGAAITVWPVDDGEDPSC
jgi:crossover junction endodeoxyribonuclease RusA